MKRYADLDLRKLREENDLDFAHYKYKKGMTVLDNGPEDMHARYWKDGRKLWGNEYTYLLFKNSDEITKCVKRSDIIEDDTYVDFRVKSLDQLEGVCASLRAQLGDDYRVTYGSLQELPVFGVISGLIVIRANQ